MKGKWKLSYGVAQGMKGVPQALHHEGKITFAFKTGTGKVYLVTADEISSQTALGWIKFRIHEFVANGGRESPKHKVLRKVIAAHGGDFVNGLRRDLAKIPHGLMEWHTMFSIRSHTASMGRPETEKVMGGGRRSILIVRSDGQVEGISPRVAFNDGKERS